MLREPEEWRRFEQRVADYFAANGYDVEINAVLVGRSGARHELDVLATKSDGLVTTRVGVECKAWAAPIEKDVVAKLSFVVNDLAINKGLVVSLHGWRLGAEQIAADLGIDLWGPTEIEQHLREIGTATDARTSRRVGLGWAVVAAADRAEGLARAEGRRRSGLRTRTVEELAWFGRVWLPCFTLELSIRLGAPNGHSLTATRNVRAGTCWRQYLGSSRADQIPSN